MAKKLIVGDRAPTFKLPADGGDEISSESLLGKTVILYFYPKDDTSGCTKEAIEFTNLLGKFDKEGAVVLGVSKNDIKAHDKFVKKHKLKVRLLSDSDGSLCESYAVWVEKSMYGRKYMGIERSTFLIDENGMIKAMWRKVKVTGHAEAVLNAVKQQ
jgi:peroxiredoxin Q/BCP